MYAVYRWASHPFAHQYSYTRIRFQSLTQNYIEYTCEITAQSGSV